MAFLEEHLWNVSPCSSCTQALPVVCLRWHQPPSKRAISHTYKAAWWQRKSESSPSLAPTPKATDLGMLPLPSPQNTPTHRSKKINSTKSSGLRMPHPCLPPLLCSHLLPRPPDPGALTSPSLPWCHTVPTPPPTTPWGWKSMPAIPRPPLLHCWLNKTAAASVQGSQEPPWRGLRLPGSGDPSLDKEGIGALPLPANPGSPLEKCNTAPTAHAVCTTTTPV